jgi:hypothetical protein
VTAATLHDAEPGPEVFDRHGQPVLETDRDVGPRFPLYAGCAICDMGCWRPLGAGGWRHLACCKHCPQAIEQIPGTGIWTTMDGFTVCVKGQGLDTGLLHEPMPEI